jgi:cytochrome c biogenesis protein CcdA
MYFILGRIVGLVFLGMAIATFSFFADLPPLYFVVAFGILSILFGVIVIAQVTGFSERFAGIWPWKKSTGTGNPGKHHGKKHFKKALREGAKARKFKNSYIFGLGVARGATPCLKILILVPLLVAVDIYLALAMILVYALTSSIYPIIGFLSGSVLQSAQKHATYVKVGAALVLVAVGVYSIINVMIQPHTGGG